MATNDVHGTKPLLEAGCEDPCSFCVRSRESEEIVRDFTYHVKTYHGLDMARADVLKSIHPAKVLA